MERLPAYVDRLLTHMDLTRSRENKSGPVATIFFGGGTPSLLSPAQVGEILDRAARLWDVSKNAEISLEANPGTLNREKLSGYVAAGINRLSLGVQTFHADLLYALGRIHSCSDIEKALTWARRAGFSNIGIDLIFGFPGQSVSSFRSDLRASLQADPEHLSVYGLTVEEGTPFGRLQESGGLLLPGEDLYAQMFREADEFLDRQGYTHYEISNYSKPGYECRHNLMYWRRQPFTGIGAGAHSFIDHSWGERRSSPADIGHYFRCLEKGRDPSRSLEVFSRAGAMSETLYLGLRTARGVSEQEFLDRFGARMDVVFPDAIKRLADNLIFADGDCRMGPRGWLIYDFLIREFL